MKTGKVMLKDACHLPYTDLKKPQRLLNSRLDIDLLLDFMKHSIGSDYYRDVQRNKT